MICTILIGYQLGAAKLENQNSNFFKTVGAFASELDLEGQTMIRKRITLLYPLMTCIKDLFLVWVSFMEVSFYIKFLIYMFITIVFLIFIIKIQPHKTLKGNCIDGFNQVVDVIFLCLMAAFKLSERNNNVLYGFGNIFIFFLIAAFLVHNTLTACSCCEMSKTSAKGCFAKCCSKQDKEKEK